jgi:hypothetical protein
MITGGVKRASRPVRSEDLLGMVNGSISRINTTLDSMRPRTTELDCG